MTDKLAEPVLENRRAPGAQLLAVAKPGNPTAGRTWQGSTGLDLAVATCGSSARIEFSERFDLTHDRQAVVVNP